MNVSVLVVSQGTGTRSILGVTTTTTTFAIIIPLDTMAMESVVITAFLVATMMIAVRMITIMIVVIPLAVDHVVIVRIFTQMVVDREATTTAGMIVVAVKEPDITIMNVGMYVESFYLFLRSCWP
jgi:hypothetical protein